MAGTTEQRGLNQRPALVIRPVRLADATVLGHRTTLPGSAAQADPEELKRAMDLIGQAETIGPAGAMTRPEPALIPSVTKPTVAVARTGLSAANDPALGASRASSAVPTDDGALSDLAMNNAVTGPDDASQIAAIYAHHVHNGTATFDTEAPTLEAWHAKIAHSLEKGWPFLVAVEGVEVLGYAYAAQFRDRPAYRHSCEDSIYIRADRLGEGLGSALLAALIKAADRSDFTQMLAVISEGEPASVALHSRLGFRHAGRMEKVGRKFGKWLDTIYMQRALAGAPLSEG